MTSFIMLKTLFPNVLNKSKKKKKVKMKSLVPKKEKIDYGICRICDEEKGQIPIFNNAQPNIPKEIQNIAGVTISETDDLPKYMCQSCLDLLNGCIMFRELCQRTNKKMIELSIKRENSPEINNYHEEHRHSDDNDSYNIPSPTFSDNLELQTCLLCNQEFYDTELYNTHFFECKKVRKVHKVASDPNNKSSRRYLCDVCGKVAKSNANLLVHMGTHENIFPFKCEECPYQGRTMDLLKVHKRSHLVDKPYKCTQCPKATTTASNLAKHMRHVHSTNRPFKCNYCEKGFSYQHDMKRHIKDIHLRQGTVECDICSKKFNTKKILQGHRWKIHKIKGERQGRLPMYLQYQTEEIAHNDCDRIIST